MLFVTACDSEPQPRDVPPAPTAVPQPPYEKKILNGIRLSDGAFHELEIRANGVYLDGVRKAETSFDEVWPLTDTVDYWNYPDVYFKNSSTGHYYLFGTHTVMGVCGMSNYAVVHIDSQGKIQISENSPDVCMGDNPSEIRFSVNYVDGECHPTWNLAGRLEFDAFTFKWKDLTKKRK